MNKNVLITGASRGIGAAAALKFASHGFNVCINYCQNKPQAIKIKQQIDSLNQKATIFCADISNETDIIKLFQHFDANFTSLDVFINNAGILFHQCAVLDMDAERINKTFQTNVTGSFICAREAVKRMSTKLGGKGGTIVNVSSRAAILGSANEYVDYAASKAAIDTFTIGLANELATQNIRVNAVRPGLINTEIHASGGDAKRVERISPNVPMQRGGSADEVAEAIYWLASDLSSYTTGSFIDCSGGR